jgi:hypothetical protein
MANRIKTKTLSPLAKLILGHQPSKITRKTRTKKKSSSRSPKKTLTKRCPKSTKKN